MMTPSERQALLRKILQQKEPTNSAASKSNAIPASIGKAGLTEGGAKIVTRCHDVRKTPVVGDVILELCNLQIDGDCARVSLDGILPQNVCEFENSEAFFAVVNFTDNLLVFDNIQPFAKRLKDIYALEIRPRFNANQIYGEFTALNTSIGEFWGYGSYAYREISDYSSADYSVSTSEKSTDNGMPIVTSQEDYDEYQSNTGEVIKLGGGLKYNADYMLGRTQLGYYDFGVFDTLEEAENYIHEQIQVIKNHPIFINNTNENRNGFFTRMYNSDRFGYKLKQKHILNMVIPSRFDNVSNREVYPKITDYYSFVKFTGFTWQEYDIARFSEYLFTNGIYANNVYYGFDAGLIRQVNINALAKELPFYFTDIPNRTYYTKRLKASVDFAKYVDETNFRDYKYKVGSLSYQEKMQDPDPTAARVIETGSAKYKGAWETDKVNAPEIMLKVMTTPTFNVECYQVAAKKLVNCEYAVAKKNKFLAACRGATAQAWSKMTALLGDNDAGLKSFALKDEDGNSVTMTAVDDGWQVQAVKYTALINRDYVVARVDLK